MPSDAPMPMVSINSKRNPYERIDILPWIPLPDFLRRLEMNHYKY